MRAIHQVRRWRIIFLAFLIKIVNRSGTSLVTVCLMILFRQPCLIILGRNNVSPYITAYIYIYMRFAVYQNVVVSQHLALRVVLRSVEICFTYTF